MANTLVSCNSFLTDPHTEHVSVISEDPGFFIDNQ